MSTLDKVEMIADRYCAQFRISISFILKKAKTHQKLFPYFKFELQYLLWL
jgi:hypothetical protein